MITDEQIEDILYGFTKTQTEFSTDIIRTIVGRMRSVGKLASFDDLNSLEETSKTTEDIQYITRQTKKFQKKQLDDLEDRLWELVALLYYDVWLAFEEEERVRLEHNLEVMRAMNEAIEDAKKQLEELIKNPALIMRDLKMPAVKRAYSLTDAYKSAVAEASNYITLPDDTSDIALKRTTMQLLDSGVRYKRNDTSENAKDAKSANKSVRMNILDSMKRVMSKLDKVVSKQFGGEAVELSAHFAPAPDHAPAQGHIFANAEFDKMQNGEDFTDIDGITYEGFERQIGEWNCRHYVKSVKLNAKPQYTQAQLDKILEDNERGVTIGGKHYTLYECTQIQRGYERSIRKAKQTYIMAKEIDNKPMQQTYRNKVGELTSQYKLFSNKCDLPAKLERIKVQGYQ